jgi:nitroreductase
MTPSISASALISRLQERYATKLFDANKQIDDATWSAIEQSLILTPSSFGLQPWKFIVLKNKEIREQLVPHSWGQRQVADASHLVIMAVKTSVDEAYIANYIQSICAARGITPDNLEGYRQMMVGSVVQGMNASQQTDWATKQAYIALGSLMTCAALLGLDACPMEGFVKDKYDEILGLTAEGLTTAVICPVGYRSADDKYAELPKVRFSAAEVIEHR